MNIDRIEIIYKHGKRKVKSSGYSIKPVVMGVDAKWLNELEDELINKIRNIEHNKKVNEFLDDLTKNIEKNFTFPFKFTLPERK